MHIGWFSGMGTLQDASARHSLTHCLTPGWRLARPLVGGDTGLPPWPDGPRIHEPSGAGSYSFFDAVDAASPCVAAVAGSSVAIVFSVNFSYSQSMRMLSMPAIPPSAYDADTLK